MRELYPCRACGSGLGPFVAAPDGKQQVICSTCGSRGPYQNQLLTAEQGWNQINGRIVDDEASK